MVPCFGYPAPGTVLATPGDVAGFVESLRSVLDDAEALGKAARTRCIEHFDMPVVAAQWAELLTDLHPRGQ